MTNNEVGQNVYELAQKIGATSQKPEIMGYRAIMHFHDQKNLTIEEEDVIRYCQEKGYSIQTLEHEQEKCFYGYIRVPVGLEELSIPESVTSSPSMIERLVGVGRLLRVFRKTRNSPVPDVIRKPIESKIYCTPTTMSFDLEYIETLAPILEDLSHILYNEPEE